MERLRKIFPQDKWRLTAILSLSFSISFSALMFMPIDMFLHNPHDYVVSWKFLLPCIIVLSLFGFVALSLTGIILFRDNTIPGIIMLLIIGLLVLIARFVFFMFPVVYLHILVAIGIVSIIWFLLKKKLGSVLDDILLLIGVGGVITTYIQVLFMNGDMREIRGGAMYGIFTISNVLNLLMWIAIALSPLGLWFILRKRKMGLWVDKTLVFSCLLISGMQITGLVATAASTELPVGIDEDIPRYISYERIVDFSRDNNILVFIIDHLDVVFLDEVLHKYPELYEQLDGFTFYRNNIAGFTTTFPSVTTMLTQHFYEEGQTFEDFWDEAWAQHSAIDILRDNGFITNLYLDRLTTYGSLCRIYDRADNINDYVSYTPDYRSILSTTSRLSMGRMMPYLLKDYFLGVIDSSFGNNFFLREDYEEFAYVNPVVGVDSDLAFYEFIRKMEFTASSRDRVFMALHMNGAHISTTGDYGYHFDFVSGAVKQGGGRTDSIRACFEMLRIYFEKMKELGVYDISTIIILTDHGAHNIIPGSAACLLIKPAGVSGPLTIDTVTELTNLYFSASVLEMADISHDSVGVSYYDVIGGVESPVRLQYVYSNWWNERHTTRMIVLESIFEVSGNPGDPSSWFQVWRRDIE
jgi:hypothetical protein